MTNIYDLDTIELKQKYHDLDALDKKVRAIMKEIDDDVNSPFPSLSARVYEHMAEISNEVGSRNL